MDILAVIRDPDSASRAVLILAAVASLGLVIGRFQLRGVGLGVAGVLFSGLLFGHFGWGVNDRILDFVRESGLILFVYGIGIQVGPGFFSSLRRDGLPLNVMAVSIVALGVAVALTAHFLGGLPTEAVVGVLAGATTNTPSLGAAQQALKEIAGSEVAKIPAMGYAVTYPFGVIGIILTMLLIRAIFRLKPESELAAFQARKTAAPPLHAMNLEVTNPNLAGIALEKLPGSPGKTMVISRILKDGRVFVPGPETVLSVGDVLLAVGPEESLEELRLIVGKVSPLDLREMASDLETRRVVITQKSVLGLSIGALDLVRRFGVTITRLSRMELEFAAHPGLELRFGDTVLLVGEPEAIQRAARALGNSPKQLNDPQILALLLGIGVGVFLGALPIPVPGLPAPLRLGVAGGPLLAAILLSRIGKIGRVVWHLPISANFFIRELGIALFLACVGLRAGAGFLETLLHGNGVAWVVWGAAITFLPLAIVGTVSKVFFRFNFTAICGVLAGASTSPPSLAFANNLFGSEAPALAYAAVYPLSMLLRVLAAQVLAILLWKS